MQRLAWLRSAAAAIACAAAVSLPVTAQGTETINLTAVAGYAPTASWVKVFEEFFIPEVDRRLAETGTYRIDWNKGFSGTIVKPRGELEAVETGLGDIGIVVTAFHVDRLPLYNVAFVTPFVTTDVGLVVRTIDALTEQFPAMRKSWDRYDQVFLASAGSVDNYQVVCKEKVEALAGFEGLKIGGAGSNLLWLQGLGATGVTSNLGDFFNLMQTGVTDCTVVWAEAAAAYKMYEIAPYFIKADLGATNSFAVTFNRDRWNGLPDEVKDVLAATAADYRDALADYVAAAAEEGVATYVENGGTVIEFTQGQREEWASSLPNIAEAWAEAADAQGLPGSAVLSAYMDVMRANDQAIARHWDRE